MSHPGDPSLSGPGERWSVNMPAVIGVVFVFVVGVIVWVIATSGGDDGDTVADVAGTLEDAATTSAATIPPASTAGGTTPVTTTPPPLPDASSVPSSEPGDGTPTTEPPSTESPTTGPPATEPPATEATQPPATAAPPEVTTAPDAGPDAVPGDLGISGRPMQRPGCEDSFITVLASAIGDQASAGAIANVLETYPGSNYLRTDQTCSSLNPASNGQPIYVVYFGPFGFASDACAARAEGTPDAYARQLSEDLGPDHGVPCPDLTTDGDADAADE